MDIGGNVSCETSSSEEMEYVSHETLSLYLYIFD